MSKKKIKMSRAFSFPLSKKILGPLSKNSRRRKENKGFKHRKRKISAASTSFIVSSQQEQDLDKTYIHIDIIKEVFLRLPVKALHGFKSLSKASMELISSTHFVASYLECRRIDCSSVMLGFFFEPGYNSLPLRFLPTSSNGEELMKEGGKLGVPPFDESLSFLTATIISLIPNPFTVQHIVASSNGLLLCRTRKEKDSKRNVVDYYVCNPVIKQWVGVRRPPNMDNFICVAEGFLCEDKSYPCLDWVSYKIVRGLLVDPDTSSCDLDVQIFCSKAGEWISFKLTTGSCSFRMPFRWQHDSVVSQKGTVCTNAYLGGIVFLDFLVFSLDDPNMKKQRLQIVHALAPVSKTWLGLVQGCIHCVSRDHLTGTLEMWELIEDINSETTATRWFRKFRVNVHDIFPDYYSRHWFVQAFHPLDSAVVMISNDRRSALFHMKNKSLEFITQFPHDIPYIISPYIWPCWPPRFLG